MKLCIFPAGSGDRNAPRARGAWYLMLVCDLLSAFGLFVFDACKPIPNLFVFLG